MRIRKTRESANKGENMFAVCSGWIAQHGGKQNTKVTLLPDDMSDLSKEEV